MTRFRRILAATAILLCAALAGGHGAMRAAPPPARPMPAATVEPTLSLVLDLGLEDIEATPRAARGRLVLELSAFDDLSDLTLRAVLPPDLAADGGERLPERLPLLRRGATQKLILPLRAARARGQAIRIEVEFDDASGRHFRLGQGIAFEAAPAEPGKVHAGAYEVMGTTIDEVRR